MVYKAEFLANLKPAMCSICLNSYDSDDHIAIELPNCSHLLGKSCLEELVSSGLASYNKCPTCRSELFEADPAPKYEDMLDDIRGRFANYLGMVLADTLRDEENLEDPSQQLVSRLEVIVSENIFAEYLDIEDLRVHEFAEAHGLELDWVAIEAFLEDAKQALFDTAWVCVQEALGTLELHPSQELIQVIEQIGSAEPEELNGSENGHLNYGGNEEEEIMEVDG